MRVKNIAVLFITALMLSGTDALAQDAGAGGGAPREISISAKKYEFNPSVITVKKGEHVKLIITATDRDHGFKLDAFKINQHLKKGEPATVEFTADQVGEFPFQCSVICGMGHHRMKGKLVVED